MNTEILELKRANRMVDRSSSSILSRMKVRKVIGNLIRNRSVQRMKKGVGEKSYMNLGSGGNIFKDFINVDYEWSKELDLCWDARKGFPLRSNSLKGIFTEHTLEHFTWEEAIKSVLPECFRVLEVGGTIRICVPNAEMCIEKYQEAKAKGEVGSTFDATYDGGNRLPLTPMMHVNNTFRRIYEPLQVGHKMAYDFQTLEYFLHCVGFVDITKESYLHGRDPMLLVDYKKRASESLYVEATKPLIASAVR